MTSEEYLKDLERQEKRCTERLAGLERQENRNAAKDPAKMKAERQRLARIRGLIKRIREAADHKTETPEKHMEQRSCEGKEIEIPEKPFERRKEE